MMKRTALLISNPGEKTTDENYCRGVFVDVKNYKNFLTSPLGGAWEPSEIAEFYRPTCEQVDAAVSKLSSYDYSIVLFSGHGYVSGSNQSTILEFKANEEYDSLNLRQNTTKRTIILDCCRKVYPERIEEKYAIDAMVKAFKLSLDSTKCRRAYDKEIEKCSQWSLVCYSCVKGEVSGDDGSNGGFYASSLIRAANRWFEQNNVDLSKYYDSYSVVEAHNAAIPYVSRLSDGKQNPDISKSKSGPYFPFAIMAA